MLDVRNLSKQFSGILAVNNVSFQAKPGEVTGYLGPNGSGKSTTIKIIAGLIEPSAGAVLFRGEPVRRDLIAWKSRIGYVPEEPHLYLHLSGLEYLTMVGELRGLQPAILSRRIEGMLHLLSLTPSRDIAIASYSKGMRQKVLLAAALLHDPELLLLDEPFSGLDVSSTLMLRQVVLELAARGKVVLFSSHELETVERVSSRVVILHRGRVVADDAIDGLRTLMALPTLEQIFAELAVEQDPAIAAREMADLICH
jgi:ABC-2 type transport system ATP-binding protein